MLKRLLAPTDFSSCSLNALRYTVQLSRNFQIEEVIIMHAFIAPVAYGDTGAASSTSQLAQEQQRKIEEGFKMIEKAIPELKDINYTTRTKNAMLTDATVSTTQESKIDLIVMGTAGATGIDEVVVGTNAFTIIKEVNCPVLIIPERARYKPLNQIVLANDFKSMASKTWDPLKILSKAYGSNVTIVHIQDYAEIQPSQAEEIKKTERYFKHIKHSYYYLKHNDVEKGLEEYIHQHRVDLLTITPRKHLYFDRIFGGGESKNLIFHTQVPLLALPEVH